MNWEIELVDRENYVRVKCSGRFSVEDQNLCIEKLFSAVFWHPGLNLLFDNRNFDFGSVDFQKTSEAVRNFQVRDEKLGNGKIALLMNSKINYGLGRQFQLISENKLPNEIAVFDDERAATQWLTASPVSL